jgi:hypothetical protein
MSVPDIRFGQLKPAPRLQRKLLRVKVLKGGHWSHGYDETPKARTVQVHGIEHGKTPVRHGLLDRAQFLVAHSSSIPQLRSTTHL